MRNIFKTPLWLREKSSPLRAIAHLHERLLQNHAELHSIHAPDTLIPDPLLRHQRCETMLSIVVKLKRYPWSKVGQKNWIKKSAKHITWEISSKSRVHRPGAKKYLHSHPSRHAAFAGKRQPPCRASNPWPSKSVSTQSVWMCSARSGSCPQEDLKAARNGCSASRPCNACRASTLTASTFANVRDRWGPSSSHAQCRTSLSPPPRVRVWQSSRIVPRILYIFFFIYVFFWFFHFPWFSSGLYIFFGGGQFWHFVTPYHVYTVLEHDIRGCLSLWNIHLLRVMTINGNINPPERHATVFELLEKILETAVRLLKRMSCIWCSAKSL